MRGEHLGELEELVLLSVGSQGEQAYAVNIMAEIKEYSNRIIDVTAIHSVLRRLEKKGLVSSKMGGATHERGGRRKRFFTLTIAGRKALDDSMLVRMELYKKLLGAQLGHS
jgi:DNA-binding PadR family transcriptional regulator